MMLQDKRVMRGAALLCGVAAALPALAHVEGTASGGGFVSGLSHPIGGLDHVLAMVAVGLWGAQLGAPLLWVLPLAFPLMMACGAAMGLMGYPLPLVEVGIAASAIALGLVVLLEAKLPVVAAVVLVGFFALFHGHAHGTELPAGHNGLLYSIGFVISTGLLHAAGIAMGAVHRWASGRVALRVAGGGVLAGGVFFLVSSFGWFG